MTGNREYRNDVFCMLMEDPQNALELYNAVNHSDYKDAGQVQICTLDNGVSLTVRNDASFVLDMHLSIYEHQSTICPNMPVRSLIYLTSILKDVLKGRNIYGRRLVRIPTPKFVVFYNGSEEQPERYEMRLSDAFEKPEENPEVELVCTVYNINYGKNTELLSECRFLREYMVFVDYVREFHRKNGYKELTLSIEQAIDRCIEEDVLKDFLMKNRGEVVKVMRLDYTFERQLTLEREDSRREGFEEGIEEGRKEGIEKGIEKGIKEGRAEGELRKLLIQVHKKLQKQKSIVQISEELEETEEDIRPIYEVVFNNLQDFDVERICSKLIERDV